MELAVACKDRQEGAMVVWGEWESNEKNFPAAMRQKFLHFMDDKLHSKGFPSLRELVEML